jgi:D-methionine transport system substrate-binding protein
MSRTTLLRTVLAATALTISTLSFAQTDAPLRVGTASGPYTDFMHEAVKIAKKQGLQVKVVEFTEPTHINEATQTGDIDLNNFQHVPYMDKQNAARGYKIVAIKPSYLSPAGVYAPKYKTLKDLPNGASIGLPNDPSNEARSLYLLQQAGLIKLKANAGVNAGIPDVAENPKKFKFVELDAGQLPRAVQDLDAAVINLSRGILAGLKPEDAKALEDHTSQWAIIWAARADKKDDPRIKQFIKIYESDEMKQVIRTKSSGSILPLW